MHSLLQDARYSVRLLLRSPGFAVTSIATLALAIGANAAIFSAVQGILIAPLPYAEPDRLIPDPSTNAATARQYYEAALAQADVANGERPELAEARAYVAKR